MHCQYIGILIFIVIITTCYCHTFTQKAAKLQYLNTKYISNLTILTSRKSRKSPYLTNVNATLLTPWEKNVTVSIDIQNMRSKAEKYQIQFNLCDGFKMKWLAEWLVKNTDVNPVCPAPSGTYHFIEIEFPPKNIPLPLSVIRGSFHCTFTFFMTKNSDEKLAILDGYIIS